jgi:hypothetical protein
MKNNPVKNKPAFQPAHQTMSYRSQYTVAGKAIGFALEQPLHVVALARSASGILK